MVRRLVPAFLLMTVTSSCATDAPAPMAVELSVDSLKVHEGFHATLFAGEPDVVQPIAMTTDARGRLWVVECVSYAEWTTDQFGNDRVSIFADEDGDGR